jgi:cyclopropane fatty-acyl-phospholipid synthase-like methyltransferase
LHGDTVVGIDFDAEQVRWHRQKGRNVTRGATTDPDFWEKVDKDHSIELVMLALPNLRANLDALEQLREAGGGFASHVEDNLLT